MLFVRWLRVGLDAPWYQECTQSDLVFGSERWHFWVGDSSVNG